jgi:hypothetical protein
MSAAIRIKVNGTLSRSSGLAWVYVFPLQTDSPANLLKPRSPVD